MEIGYLGLGKMGKNMVLRLLEKQHSVVAWNRSPEPRQEVTAAGAKTVETLADLVQNLAAPRFLWLMLPAGDTTETILQQLIPLLQPNDTVVDGANSWYKDSIRRAALLAEHKLHFLDAGVSGGPAGARSGACLMVGGEQHIFDQYQNVFADVAAPNACQFFSGHGAGHFVKMVHNGIEYGMMQAIGEGFAVLRSSSFDIDVQQAARIYNQGSVIESRLIGWLESGYQKHGQDLQDVSGSIGATGEGGWTVQTAQELHVPVPVIEKSVQFRTDSQTQPSYCGQVVSVLRSEFGGHNVSKK